MSEVRVGPFILNNAAWCIKPEWALILSQLSTVLVHHLINYCLFCLLILLSIYFPGWWRVTNLWPLSYEFQKAILIIAQHYYLIFTVWFFIYRIAFKIWINLSLVLQFWVILNDYDIIDKVLYAGLLMLWIFVRRIINFVYKLEVLNILCTRFFLFSSFSANHIIIWWCGVRLSHLWLD